MRLFAPRQTRVRYRVLNAHGAERENKTISFRLQVEQSRILATGGKAGDPFGGSDRKTLVPVAHDYEQLLAVQGEKYRFSTRIRPERSHGRLDAQGVH